MGKNDISEADKITISLIDAAKTISEVKAFQVDGRSKAVEDAINARGAAIAKEEEGKPDETEEDHSAPLTVKAPYAYYDDDGALHSWQPGIRLGAEDAEFLAQREVPLVNWVTFEG